MFNIYVSISLCFAIVQSSYGQSSCHTPESIIGQCTSVYDCPSVLAQFQGRLTRQAANYLRSLQCEGGNGQYPHVCCISFSSDEQQPKPMQQRPRKRPSTVQSHVDQRGEGSFIPSAGTCGQTSLAHRIYGGDETQLDDYPWMVLLEYQSRNRNRRERKLSCGGSLINSRYVLTAAHCLVGEIETRVGELVGVRLGEYDTTKEIDCLGDTCADPVLYMGVEEKIPHTGYDESQKNRANDIGLIRLNGEVTYTDYIRPICLPSSVNSPRSFSNEKLVSVGWGRTLTKRQSATKQQVNLPVVDQSTCIDKYSALGIDVTDNQMCAGGNYGQDTCDGDSGNPLMKVAANAWVIDGIVSFGRGCGLEDWPAVYTRVSNYDNWIRSNLKS